MSDSKRLSTLAPTHDQLDLTRTIKKLSIPVRHTAEFPGDAEVPVLLLCRDSAIRKWGPRWLAQAGARVEMPNDPEDALAIARAGQPRIIVVEGRLQGSAGRPLYEDLADAADLDVPVIVLSANSKEAVVAAEADVFDVARKPYAWQLIGRRVRYAAELSEARKKMQEHTESLSAALSLAEAARLRLRSRESFEPVTGLPNKTKFLELLRRGMAAVDRDGSNLAVFVIGFNRFRLVIEAMGQEHADLVLTEVGRILSDCLRSVELPRAASSGLQTSAAASIDHFRFGLMITYPGDVEQLAVLREDLLERLSRPLEVAGQAVYLSACLGVAWYPHDAQDVDSLLQRADNAMRDAQSRGGGFKYYCAETDAAAARKLKIEHMLHEALSDQGLTLAYQPINETSRGRVIAAEALLRWRQPDGSFISPTEFVPIAEESELMTHIGEFVIDESCRQLSAWHDAGIPVPRMCVNVSRVQLRTGRLAEALQRSLANHKVEPSHLELEISERGVLSGDFDVLDQLHELHDIGIRLALDDFGTGDSAIAYLRRMPLDVLKIDRSYIAGIVENPKDAALTSAMVALAQRLDMTVVAEGVETREQLKVLREFGCDAFQGFLVSRPVSANTFVSLLKKTN